MTTLPPGLLPEGLRDRLPPEAGAASRLLRVVQDCMHGFGYERVSPPMAEFEEGLAGRLKAGQGRDLLRIVDPVSRRTLALRPDITAQVGRIAATRLAHRPRPLRLCYGGAILKLHATQLRPERELLQVGAELIGTDTVPAVREILRLAVDALAAAGVEDITVDLTLPDLVQTLAATSLPIPSDRVEQVRAELDEKDAGAISALGAEAYLPLIGAAGPFDAAMEKLRAIDDGGALKTRLDALEEIAGPIAGKAALTLDPTERHGFEYQSWVGFSLFGKGISGEIGRGGSYTILHQDGAEESAVGFSLYIDPLIDAGLGRKDAPRLFLPLGTPDNEAAAWREQGWRTVAALSESDGGEALGCTHHLIDGEARPY
ncbi:MAG: ATP phosphoribosyltransferase regulatory subunit [Parasphingopyxis sp.]|uniref:ATP phosphoribosyltransferase regulatory subunit n=1 Tax=Parasphingopyxis sp. TaxID=1920299 RepID=UPI0032ED3D44